jgi:hypothetical protein
MVATEKIIDNEHNAVHKKIKELLKIPFSFAKKNGKYVFRITEFRSKNLNLPVILESEKPWEIYGAIRRMLF